MIQPGRKFEAKSYRFSINGQEKEKEINENFTSAEFWMYNARIVRRWNIDPKPQAYSSPYSAFDNSPIWRSDPLGDTTRPIFSYVNEVSSDGNWAKGALLFPGNTYVKAQNAFASTANTVVDLGTNKQGLGVGLMGIIDGWGQDLKDWWRGTKKYHTETPASQQLSNAGQWFSNPDNVYGTMSDAVLIYGTYRLGKQSGKSIGSNASPFASVVAVERNIALGVNETLPSFAKKVGGETWNTWGSTNFPVQFNDIINNSSTKIHFNLTGPDGNLLNVWSAVSEGAKGFEKARATSWELYQLYNNPAAQARTTFYHNNQIVPNPFK